MERRHFLHNLAHAAAVPTIFSSLAFNSLDFSSNSNLSNTIENGKIIVIIKMDGGNDGLNTVIPLDQMSNLSKARPRVILPENKIVSLNTNDLGLHPSLSDFKSLFNEDRLKIIQNVGYPNPDFSHFRSMDIWQSASDSDEYLNSGWMARYIENKHPAYPEAYPSDAYPHPLAVELGWQSSLLFTGQKSLTSFQARNPTNFLEIINEFDNENFLQFLAGGNDSEFRSSQDFSGTNISNIFWDYTGLYGVGNISNNMYLKTLTLDYDYFSNEYFELSVINDGKIELYHPASQTVYEFVGRGYIQYLKTSNTKDKSLYPGLTDT